MKAVVIYLCAGMSLAGVVQNVMLRSCPVVWRESPQTRLARMAVLTLFWPAFTIAAIGQDDHPSDMCAG